MPHSLKQSVARSANRQQTGAATGDSRQQTSIRQRRWPWIYALIFVLSYVFATIVYGDVFRRTAEANFITTDSTQMKFLTDQAWGTLYLAGRWLLVAFNNLYVGAALLSALLTATAALTDYVVGASGRWRGIGSLVPAAMVAWMLYRGTNLYYKYEPSLFLLLPLLALLILGLAAIVRRLCLRKKGETGRQPSCGKSRFAFGSIIPLLCFVALTLAARHYNENDILTARMQLRSQQADWEGMIDDALSARRPSRAVALYYVIALEQTGQLLERMYDLPYDFPTIRLEKKDGNEEYGIFLADGNLYAGLSLIGYRCLMDHTVINGPNIYNLKRMVICALVNDEASLARKYLDILAKQPGQQDFCNRYAPMVGHSDLVDEDAELAAIKALAPTSSHFEQNYRSPAFLGYNTGLASGSDASLATAIAACLYTKEIANAIPYIRIYAQKKGNLPVSVQQALAILGNSNPAVAQEFASYIQSQESMLLSFVTAAKPIIDERMRLSQGKSDAEKEDIKYAYNVKLRETLGEDWVGTYFYYYYCENNDRNQVKPKTQSAVN